MAEIDPQSLRHRQVLPNGVAFAGMVNDHILYNFLLDRPSDLRLPSIWREAKLVASERVPLDLFVFNVPENTEQVT